jgi:tape measure domain-containing protein
MAEYNINFSTNASQIAKELSNVQAELAKAVQMAKPGGLKIQLSLDASGLEESINTTFRKINKAIESNQRKLSRLQIGGANFRMIAEHLGAAEGQRERGRAIAEPIRLRAQAAAFEPGSLTSMQKVLQALRIEASQIRPNTVEWARFQQQIGKVTLELKQADKTAESIQLTQQLGALAPGSLSRLDKQLTILKNRARDITPNTVEWKKLNKEIQKVETSIAKVSKKPLSAGQRAGAAGGAFLYGGGMGGGVGSAFGGIAGGLAGGVPGAFAGAAIGQVADNLGTALAGITSQAAAVQKMQRGLAMASVDAKDFAEAQAAVGEMSQKLLMPLEQTTEYFAQLRANTKEYNLSVADTKEILEGTALAIMATGGSAEDLDGAMRAVVQIMSKGGVQAEELRGQLGERFPGAVVKFAQANKMSFEELQAGLEAGTIGIREFINFAKKNYTDYAKFSEQLATAPEYAGQRLKIALEEVSLSIGSLFADAGADVQNTLTNTLNAISTFVQGNKQELKTIADGLASLVKLVEMTGEAFTRIIGKEVAQAFLEAARAATTIRNLLGKGSIQTIASERQDVNKRINEKFQDIATRKRMSGGGIDLNIKQAEIELEALQKRRGELDEQYRGMGGNAAYQATQPDASLTFGGAGAGMSIDRAAKEDKENKKKVDNLESFERLRDQLANAYNQAEIERIKAEYELRKRLQEDIYDMQEFGANRLQKQNLQFLRALAKAEQDRQDTLMDAQLKVAEAAGKIAPSAPMLPAAGGGSSGLTSFTGQQLARATQDASRFTGVANMCSESVKAFYKSLGISLPGVTAWADTVRKAGQTMTDWSKLQAGDIVATGRPGDTPHVGVYTGGQNVFHQSRRRGLKAGNYPDLSYFQQQGYFVRPTASAGAPRKVGSNESRDTMAGANIDIAQQNAAFAARNALIVKGSAEAKAFAQYIQESFGLPDLRLSNDLLKMRNDLIAAGVSEEEITHRQRLFEINYKYDDLLKKYPGLAGLSIDIDGKRISAIDFLKDALNEATAAERAKNDETLRGIAIQRENQMQEALRSAAPLGGMGLSAGYIGSSGQKFEEVFQQTGSKETAAYFAELQNQLTLLETRNGAIQSSIMAIGDAFGTAMTTGIASLIDGTATAQEVFATFLKSIGQALLQAAQQMIATYIAIGIAKIFAGLGGGGNFTGGTSSAVPTDAAGWGSSFQTSLPNVGSVGKIGFARGGAFSNSIVSSPTMFKFADGGAMRTGLMGEAGPEAIMPLSRGADGSLGVQANGLREAMDRQQGGANGSPVLNMSFQSTSINGVEYVSRDQLESAMAETRRNATRDGAKRGMTMTLDRIQNSSSTRRKVGI